MQALLILYHSVPTDDNKDSFWVYLLIHEEKKTIKEKLFHSVLGSQFQSCFVG